MASPDLHPDVVKHLYINKSSFEINSPSDLLDPSNTEFREKNKQCLVEYILNALNDASTDLTGEEISDCLKAAISSALDYSKTEYDKYRYIADQLGIE